MNKISKRYTILESQYPYTLWKQEVFQTAGKRFDSFKEAHLIKKQLQSFCSSIKFKVKAIQP